MKKKIKNSFFGLNASEKVRIVRKAASKASEEQLNMVKKHGGLKVLKNYVNYCK